MEYTIYNESLVYYALRDNNGMYLCDNRNEPPCLTIGYLKDAHLFQKLEEAKEVQKFFTDYKQIRKVKVIDIGEVNENI